MGKIRNIFWLLMVQLDLQALNLLSPPPRISMEQLQAIPRELNMTWDRKKEGQFHFETRDQDIRFEIFFPFEELPPIFSEEEKKGFKKKSTGYSFAFRYFQEGKFLENPLDESLKKDTGAYTLFDRREFRYARPKKELNLSTLCALLLEKQIIFYTGAGISAAAGVPTMRDLESLLDFKEAESLSAWTKRVLPNPKELVNRIHLFHEACFNAFPTAAHGALTQLALMKKTQILTENLDHLHHKTGYQPCGCEADFLRKQVDPNSLKNIDAVICIGLSRDDKGFLGWYKHYHPSGILIAIDFYPPSYLGDEDYWIEADVQEFIPELLSLLKRLHKERANL